MNYHIHTDGGARGNPGPAACGIVIEMLEGTHLHLVHEFGVSIGKATNNVAEYSGVQEALKYLINHIQEKGSSNNIFSFFLDSTLVVNQLNGIFKIKDPTLRNILTSIRFLEQQLGGTITYTYVPREQNTKADFQVNATLDSLL